MPCGNSLIDSAFSSPIYFTFNLDENANLQCANATFKRDETHLPLTFTLTQGTALVPTIYKSPYSSLSINSFNYKTETDDIEFPTDNEALILTEKKYFHQIYITYKLTKPSNINFKNQRSLRVNLVNTLDNIYQIQMEADEQQSSGDHHYILIKGAINHDINDIIKLQFHIIQNTSNSDNSDTLLHIFNIRWNILYI